MIDQILSQHKENFEKAIEHFAHELNGVRTGRANPALLNSVMVESYGSKMPLEHVASVTVSDAKTLIFRSSFPLKTSKFTDCPAFCFT